MKSLRASAWLGAIVAGALALAPGAQATGFLTQGYPAATLPLTGSETLPADSNSSNGAQQESVSIAQLAASARSAAGTAGFINALRGGDFGTNPFQRGTSGTGITTTAVYTADGWAVFAGTSTSSQWSQQTGAADIPSRSGAALRVQRTSGQTGVVPVCVAQPLTTSDSRRFQGHTGVFQFLAQSGANFSAAGGNVTASIVYGTGTNQSTASLFAGTWTGQTTAGSALQALNSTYIASGNASPTVFSVSAAIPLTATQLAVEICYTPVGTAGTNDWFEFTLAQLAVNDVGSVLAFDHRPANVELVICDQFYWQLSEAALLRPALGQALTTTTANFQIQFPEPMWKAPTPAYTAGGWSATVAAGTTAGVCSTLVAVASSTTNQGTVALCTVGSATLTAGNATQMLGSLTTGILSASAEL